MIAALAAALALSAAAAPVSTAPVAAVAASSAPVSPPSVSTAPAPAAPPSALSQGGDLFFHGDLEGAVARWETAREEGGGSRQLDALLASALTALGKRDLVARRYARAQSRFTRALAIESNSRSLRHLALTAELAQQTGGLRSLRPDESDATEELNRLLTALLLMDRPAPAAVPVSTAAASTAPAPADALAPTDAERGKAATDYARGLERYYAGDYETALSLFYESLRLDPSFEKARRGEALARAELRRRDAARRYEDGLRAFYAGDLKTARAKLQEAMLLDPANAKARETLAHIDAPPPPAP